MRRNIKQTPAQRSENGKLFWCPDLDGKELLAIHCVGSGLGFKATAKKLNLSKGLVYGWMKRAGLLDASKKPTPRDSSAPLKRSSSFLNRIYVNKEKRFNRYAFTQEWRGVVEDYGSIFYQRQWTDRKANRHKERCRLDPSFKSKIAARNLIWQALRKQQAAKVAKSEFLLGCSLDFFKDYIASKFKNGMTWQNHGEWHIDHIRPCASFDLSDRDQLMQCFHYTNLQPLWADENRRKSDTYTLPG